MQFEELEQLVIQWGEQKGILSSSTPIKQLEKTEEEFHELEEALLMDAMNKQVYVNSKGVETTTEEEIADGYGDMIVTLILGAKMKGLSLTECLEKAYNVISKRTGKMIDGKFVKDN